jgi:hypothetical protein
MNDFVEVITSNNLIFYIHKNNPYVKHTVGDTLLTRNKLYMSDKIVDKTLRIEHFLCLVRGITITDTILSIVYYWYNIYFGIFSSIISLFGFHSCFTLNPKSVMCYNIYLYIQIIFRMVNLILYAVYINSKYSVYTLIQNNIPANIIIFTSLLICQIFISFVFSTFYSCFPGKDDLKEINYEAYL